QERRGSELQAGATVNGGVGVGHGSARGAGGEDEGGQGPDPEDGPLSGRGMVRHGGLFVRRQAARPVPAPGRYIRGTLQGGSDTGALVSPPGLLPTQGGPVDSARPGKVAGAAVLGPGSGISPGPCRGASNRVMTLHLDLR